MRPVSGGKVSAAATVATKTSATAKSERAPAGARAVADAHRRPSLQRSPHQNFTAGGVCASSLAVNSAIGLLLRKKVFAHSTPGNVRSSVL